MIDKGELLVLLARPEVLLAGAAAVARAERVVSSSDREHVARFRFERDRTMALASRVVQRCALSLAAGGSVPPEDWRFTADERSRPRLEGARGELAELDFNATNTRGLVGCAVTRGALVGFDVEPIRADAPPELVARCFSSEERAALASLPEAERPARFVALWTAKEAYLKARGVGLTAPLEAISVAFADPEAPALVRAEGDPELLAWRLSQWSPTPEHVAAVCRRPLAGLASALALVPRVRWLDAVDAHPVTRA